MAIPSKQIGGSVNYNLLWQISKQLERLIEVRSNVTTSTTSTSTSTSSSTTTTTTTLDPNLIPIGTQIWTTRNLEVETYRDGTPIPQVTNQTQWNSLTTGAWCYYANNTANGVIYGKLYNWYAVAGIDGSGTPRILAPVGYHIPTNEEWTTLVTYLGGAAVAGGKMKSTGTSLWDTPNYNATNSSGFTALPGGARAFSGSTTFYGIRNYAHFWTSSAGVNPATGSMRYLAWSSENVAPVESVNVLFGASLRLIKD